MSESAWLVRLPWLQVAERRQPVVASSSGADERLHAMRWRLAAGELQRFHPWTDAGGPQ